MNKIYKSHACLYQYDYDYQKGFKWIDADNAKQSIYSFYREDDREYLVCVLNMTAASYEQFDIGVPQSGKYTEVLNSEKDIYNGCNMCNFEPVKAWKNKKAQGDLEYSITIRIAPWSAVWLTCPKRKKTVKEKSDTVKQ